MRVMGGKGVAGNTESGLTKNDKQSKKKWAKRRLVAIVCVSVCFHDYDTIPAASISRVEYSRGCTVLRRSPGREFVVH